MIRRARLGGVLITSGRSPFMLVILVKLEAGMRKALNFKKVSQVAQGLTF